jgi:hypothetical protein
VEATASAVRAASAMKAPSPAMTAAGVATASAMSPAARKRTRRASQRHDGHEHQ